jgi:dihydroorotase
VYTPAAHALVAHLLESFGALDKLSDFVSGHGRRFYGRPAGAGAETVKIVRAVDYVVPERWALEQESVVPFWAGKALNWRVAE